MPAQVANRGLIRPEAVTSDRGLVHYGLVHYALSRSDLLGAFYGETVVETYLTHSRRYLPEAFKRMQR